MKYNLIEIRPNRLDDNERWMVRYDPTDKFDRKSCKSYEPASLGFFYYPRKWGPQKAFDILKKDMVDRRAREIELLKADIDYIEKWIAVQSFFTEKAAQAFLEANRHRHTGRLRVYADSLYRNHEMKMIRDYILNLE